MVDMLENQTNTWLYLVVRLLFCREWSNPFITITPRSTLAQSCLCLISFYGNKFEKCF